MLRLDCIIKKQTVLYCFIVVDVVVFFCQDVGLFCPFSRSFVFGAVIESRDRRAPAPHLHPA